MKLKQRVADFRVRELLVDDYLGTRGEHRIYRVTKKKLTTMEAARVLAEEARVEPGEIGLAGMKDRQGVTVQHMSVPRGPEVRLGSTELKIETAGFAPEALSSAFSRGNAFELTVRALRRSDVKRLRMNLPVVREHGLPNYFDDQRFGNVTHEQGWIAKDLMLGSHELALKRLLTAKSPYDPAHEKRFKDALLKNWGDWRACRKVAGAHGAHHSIFEHLARTEDDFAGAFTYVASRLRLIHLYAFQSHVWNRAVADFVRAAVPYKERLLLDGVEGPMVAYGERSPDALRAQTSFRLPGEGLEDVTDERQLELLRDVLAEHRMVPDQFRIDGVSGFHVKGEDRQLVVTPRHLRVRPAEPDALNRGLSCLRVRFELDRGAYATLVVKRLFAAPLGDGRSQGSSMGVGRAAAARSGEARSTGPHRSGQRGSHRGRGGERGSERGRGYGGERGNERDRGYGGGRGNERDRGYGGGRGNERDRGYGGGRGSERDRSYGVGRGNERDRGYGGGRGSERDRSYGVGRGNERDRSYGSERGNERDRGYGGGRGSERDRSYGGGRGNERDRGYGGGRGNERDRSYGSERGNERDRGYGGGRESERDRSYGGGRGSERGRTYGSERGNERDRSHGGGRGNERDRGYGGGRGSERGRSYGGERGNERNPSYGGNRGDDRDRGQPRDEDRRSETGRTSGFRGGYRANRRVGRGGSTGGGGHHSHHGGGRPWTGHGRSGGSRAGGFGQSPPRVGREHRAVDDPDDANQLDGR